MRRSLSRSSTPPAQFKQQHHKSQSTDTSPRIIRTSSPSRPTLPLLHPLPLLNPEHEQERPASNSGQPFQSFTAAGRAAQSPSKPPPPGSWQPSWTQHRARHSIDVAGAHVNLKSPSPSTISPERRAEGERSGEGAQAAGGRDVVFTRDVTNRQPRSMMACSRCRRQKMKCDGPGKEPCRGCRQAGVPCIFESRARPKSISTLPTRASPFFGGPMPPQRGGTPGAGPSFYPVTAQAAPPITSRPQLAPDYAMRPREPMPPPPGSMQGSLPMAYPPPLRGHSPPLHTPTSGGGHHQQAYFTQGHPGGPPPGPQYAPAPPPGPQPVPVQAQQDPRFDSRLRSLESSFRSVSTLPGAVAGIQATLSSLVRTQEALAAQIAGNAAAPTNLSIAAPPRAAVDVPDHVWEAWRVGAWPLTPWLPGISPLGGLPAMVLSCLGRRSAMERSEQTRRESDTAAEIVMAEISRLLVNRVPWTRDEILSLGVFSTWTSDPALGTLAVGLARELQLDRPHTLRRSHDEWREWIYVVLADHMLHIPDFNVPVVHESLTGHWRELVSASSPSDPSTLDRDRKLLAWLEYSELLIEVQATQRAFDVPGASPSERRDSAERPSTTGSGSDAHDKERQRARDPWRKFASRWEAWAGACGARHDPVLSLHFNYAILFTASPVFCASERVWAALAASHEGYTQLERGRDAAFAVLQTLGSPEIGRTLGYSFPVLRPFFGLAIAHLVGMVTTLSHTPIINLPHVQSVLRQVVEMLAEAAPLDLARPVPASAAEAADNGHPAGRLPPSLLLDMSETGQVAAVGKREIVGAEPGRDLWRRLIG